MNIKRPGNWPYKSFDPNAEKALRDLVRLKDAEKENRETDALDHCLNACKNVWHLGDVLWHDGVHLGQPDTEEGFKQFKMQVCQGNEYIRICRDVGDFDKHVELTRNSAEELSVEASAGESVSFFLPRFESAAVIIAEVSAADTAMDTELDEGQKVVARTNKSKIVLTDGRRLRASEVIERALEEWRVLKGP